MSLSLRARLTLVYTVAFAALLAAGASGLYASIARGYREEIDQELADTERAARALLAQDIAEYGSYKATVAHLVTELIFGDRSLMAVDSAGNRFAVGQSYPSMPSLRGLAPAAWAAAGPVTVHVDGQSLRVLRVALPDGLALVIGHSLAPLDARLAALRFRLGSGFALIVLVGAMAGWVAARPALRPIIDIAAETERIGRSVDAGAAVLPRLPAPGARDEVATLTGAFNGQVDALERALARERAAAERQRTFLANAAHELRTPVAILQSEAEASLASGDAAEHRRALGAIADESRELGALVGDLLTLARGDTPHEMAHEHLWLDDLAARVATRARALPVAAGRTIRVGSFEAAPAVGDPALLERALLALVHNALLHAAPSPVELSAGVRVAADGRRMAWVQVRDRGPGIAVADQARVFERFERGGSGAPGTGLGLAIARAIAEAAGGTLTLESRPGEGAAFTLALPAAETPTATAGAPSPARARGGASGPAA